MLGKERSMLAAGDGTSRGMQPLVARQPPYCTSSLFSNRQRLSRSGLTVAAAATELLQSSAVHLGERLRSQFPLLDQEVNGRRLVWFDSGATSQKPTAVLNAMNTYYNQDNSNVHRGVHALAARATSAFEESREKVARLINAKTSREVVFTRNASEAINLVAYTWGLDTLKPGDEVVLSVAEHHSNLVPWQLIAAKTGAILRYVNLTASKQELDMQHFKSLLTPRTRLVALAHVSNVLASVLDVAYVAEEAHRVGAQLLLDCCQSVPHMALDVQRLGADWIVASSHKMCGPTGIGFLWGRYDLLDSMPPFMGGGEMIQDVFLDHSTYAPPPTRFEAGTPAIAEAIGLGAAAEWLASIGLRNIHEFEQQIGTYLYDRLATVRGVTLYGPQPSAPRGRASLVAFNVKGLHATDVSTLLDQSGIAIRSGHHCCQPLHRELGVNASARASLYLYNTPEEVDVFIEALNETITFFHGAGVGVPDGSEAV